MPPELLKTKVLHGEDTGKSKLRKDGMPLFEKHAHSCAEKDRAHMLRATSTWTQAACRQRKAVPIALHYGITLLAVQISRVNFEKSGVQFFAEKLSFNFLAKTLAAKFLSLTLASCKKLCHGKKQCLDPSLAQSQVLFIIDLPSRQCSFSAFPSDNNSPSFHLALIVRSHRSTEYLSSSSLHFSLFLALSSF